MLTQMLRLPAVIATTGLGRSAIYDAIKAGSFPAPIAITPRTRAWIADEIETWVRGRIAASRDSARPVPSNRGHTEDYATKH